MTVLADTTAWVDYLRGQDTPSAKALDRAIAEDVVLLGDLILAEIMRGLPDERTAKLVSAALERFNVVVIGGKSVALQAATNYRFLRSKAITVRGTIDLMIGTWCIMTGVPLLHADRDFDGMEKWLGLKRWS